MYKRQASTPLGARLVPLFVGVGHPRANSNRFRVVPDVAARVSLHVAHVEPPKNIFWAKGTGLGTVAPNAKKNATLGLIRPTEQPTRCASAEALDSLSPVPIKSPLG